MNHELPDVQAGFRKGRGTRDQIANIHWIIKKAREFQKSIYFCFIDYTKAFDCLDHNKLWKILKEMGIPDHFTCHGASLVAQLLKNPPAIWETWVWCLSWEDSLEKGKAIHSSSDLENSMDCIVHGVAKCQTRLSNFHFYILPEWWEICM